MTSLLARTIQAFADAVCRGDLEAADRMADVAFRLAAQEAQKAQKGKS